MVERALLGTLSPAFAEERLAAPRSKNNNELCTLKIQDRRAIT